MIGSLLYLSNGTRPDISFAVNMCARFTNSPSQQHIDAAIRIFSYAKITRTHGLTYSHEDILPEESRLIAGFVDADYAGCLETRRSTTGLRIHCCRCASVVGLETAGSGGNGHPRHRIYGCSRRSKRSSLASPFHGGPQTSTSTVGHSFHRQQLCAKVVKEP